MSNVIITGSVFSEISFRGYSNCAFDFFGQQIKEAAREIEDYIRRQRFCETADVKVRVNLYQEKDEGFHGASVSICFPRPNQEVFERIKIYYEAQVNYLRDKLTAAEPPIDNAITFDFAPPFTVEEGDKILRGIEILRLVLARIGEEKEYFKNHNFGEAIALMHSELSEALEAHRTGAYDKHLPNRLGVEVELADVILRVVAVAEYLKLDICGATLEKLAYNFKRPKAQDEGKAY